MMITIHQPDFLPWLGFFDRWKQSDLFIILDDVQFLRRGWHHRDRIKTATGPAWITIPVVKKGRYEQHIRHVELDQTSTWRKKHLNSIQSAYGKAPNFASLFPFIAEIYTKKHTTLIDFNMDLLRLCAQWLHIETPWKFASTMNVTTTATDRLIALCQAAGADSYLTGTGSREYLIEDTFKKAGIQVMWQAYNHPIYPQLHGEFVPMLSVLDYLMMQKVA